VCGVDIIIQRDWYLSIRQHRYVVAVVGSSRGVTRTDG